MKSWSLREVKDALSQVRQLSLGIRDRIVRTNVARRNMLKFDMNDMSREDSIRLRRLRREIVILGNECENFVTKMEDMNAICYNPIQCVVVFPFTYDGKSAVFVYHALTNELFWRFDEEKENRSLSKLKWQQEKDS